MSDMPRQLPKYVYCERTRHGKRVYYFRRGKGKRVRLGDDPTTAEFEAQYAKALMDEAVSDRYRNLKRGTHTLAWLIEQYRESSAYMKYSRKTRRDRDSIFRHIVNNAGDVAFKNVSRQNIINGREKRKDTPGAAKNFLDTMRGLFRWAVDVGHIDINPTAGVDNPPRLNKKGAVQWSQEDIAQYETFWGHGTRQRVWLHVLLYTGLRRGDAVRVGKQHVKDDVITLETEKTGIPVYIRLLPPLIETLRHGPTGDLAFICGERGLPLNKISFGNLFRKACREAGLHNRSAHGLRKAAASRAAEAGATAGELEALFGWSGGQMAAHYTRAANRKKMAEAASRKVSQTVNFPAPFVKNPAPKKEH